MRAKFCERVDIVEIGIPVAAYDRAGLTRPAFGDDGWVWIDPS